MAARRLLGLGLGPRRLTWACLWALAAALGASAPVARAADDLPEYRLKAAFLYNFALFTEWPAEVGVTLHLCVVGSDPFGAELDGLQGKAVGARSLAVQRKTGIDALKACQIVFVPPAASSQLPRVLEALEGLPVLTVADSPGAARQGVALNMAVVQNKVSFEANLRAARAAHLNLSSKLLRLATEVIQ
jgi:YfiR/HmsC-like